MSSAVAHQVPVEVRHDADAIADALGQHRPTPEQKAVIEAPLAPLLVVAGAGSGKTETMSARVVWLVANGLVRPEEVLGLTFTRKAAGELAERIGRRLRRLERVGLWAPHVDDDGTPGLGDSPTVSTYHAYAGRIVREHGLRLGVEPDSRMLSEAASWQLAHAVVTSYDGPVDALERTERTITADVVDLAGQLAEHLRTPEELLAHDLRLVEAIDALPFGAGLRALGEDVKKLRDTALSRTQVVPMLQRYAELKRERSALDFADQMSVAARLAQAFPVVGQRERQQFRAVLLDEFQDTSEAQLVLLESLFAAEGERVPVTAVGDPHQSIYGWRGASATTLAAFRDRFRDADGPARVVPLSTSWRNDAAVLDAANHAAGPLRDASLVPVTTLRPRPGAGIGAVLAERHLTAADEARGVAEWVRGRWFDDEGHRTGATAAVLCRKRSQFPAVAEALSAAGLPVEVVGIGGLLTTPEVNDLVSLLWVVQDPSRGDRLMRLLVGPAVRLGPADLDGLAAWSRELLRRGAPETSGRQVDIAGDSREQASLAEAVDELPDPDWRGPDDERISEVALRRLHRLRSVIRRMRSLTGLPLTELVHEGEQALGLDIEVLARPEHTPATARVHLDAFADVSAGFASSADRPTLGGLLEWLDAAESEERGLDQGYLEVEHDAVQVLTVHAAKGLEWDAVAVPGLSEAVFPAHNGSSQWCADPPGWRISSQGSPGQPGSWALNDKAWVSGVSELPYALRGDREGLPVLEWSTAPDVKELRGRISAFFAEGGQWAIAEERRLAYVALTRARSALLLTAPVWDTTTSPRVTSRFLTELVDAGLVERGTWVEAPVVEDGVKPENPTLAELPTAVWPHDPLGRRREQLADGADAVRAALQTVPDQGALPLDEHDDEIFVLLAERAQQQAPRDPVVTVPRHLSASAVVALATDPAAFARQLRRPMPTPPAIAARRGTAFHAWVEQHFAQAALVDITELPGAADDDPAPDEQLPAMKQHFLDSEWAGQQPLALEVAVETVIDGIAVRGRIDAVFPDREIGDGTTGFVIVDWKTGRAPGPAEAPVRTLQLAAYRVAYARLRGVPVEDVRAAFFYAADGTTVWPQLPDEDDLVELLRSIPG